MLLKYRDAEADCNKAISIDDKNAKYYFRKATALKGLGQIESAIKTYNDGLACDPKSETAKKDLELLVTAKTELPMLKSMVEQGKNRDVLTRVDSFIKSMGSNFRDLNLLKIECLINLYRVEDAYNLSNSMMRTVGQGDVELLGLRARCFFTMGDIDNAFKHLQQAVRSDPDNTKIRGEYRKVKAIEESKSTGDSAFRQGNFAEAVEKYSTCIDLAKESRLFRSKVFLNRATALSKLEKFKESVNDCNQAIAHNKEYVKAYLRRAESYQALGEPEHIQKSIEDLQEAEKLEKEETAQKSISQKLKKAKVMLKRSKKKDLYKVLGVGPTATESQIKSAYRKKALKFHPDKQSGASEEAKKEAEKNFKSVGEAYDILSDPEKKARYDSGVDVEDMDNPHAGAGGHGHGHGMGGGMGGIDPNILFQMFMQQQGGMGGGMGGFG